MFGNNITVMDVCVSVGVILTIIQLFFMWKSILADHERRKKQSTIEFYDNINKETKKLNESFKDVLDKNRITKEMLDDEKYTSFIEAANRYLTLMERFSVGVNTKVYDLKIFMRIAGRSTINTFDQLREYIDLCRDGGKRSYMYTDFEKMVNAMRFEYTKSERLQKDPQRIVHS